VGLAYNTKEFAVGFRFYSAITVAGCFFCLDAVDITSSLSTLSGHLNTLSGLIEKREKERTDTILAEVTSPQRLKEAETAEDVAQKEKQKSEQSAEAAAKFAASQKKKSNVAVLVIDVQNDFLKPKGSLAVAGTGEEYVKGCQRTLGALRGQLHIIFTGDSHPKDHVSFASRWEKILEAKAFQPFVLPRGFPGGAREQMLWPDHCVQGTSGAEVADGLEQEGDVLVKKGMRLNFDSYSGFRDDGGGLTAMESVLKTLKVEYLVIFGIATDYCVEATVLHALEWVKKDRYKGVYVIVNLCRGVYPEKSFDALMNMHRKGARLCWLQSVADGPEEKALLERLRGKKKTLEEFSTPSVITNKLKALAA
jgi:nicotinamidase/pyrazinamidase